MRFFPVILFTFFFIVSTKTFSASMFIKSTTEKALISASQVDYVKFIKGENIKVFSISGGDPAMNGAYLNLAIFSEKKMDWNVFKLANVRSFKVLESLKKGFLKIKIVRDSYDKEGRSIKLKSILFLNVLKGASGSIEIEEK